MLCVDIAEWIAAVGELLIAGVIVLELEENRRDKFLAEVAQMESYESRGRVYSSFYGTEGNTAAEKSYRTSAPQQCATRNRNGIGQPGTIRFFH